MYTLFVMYCKASELFKFAHIVVVNVSQYLKTEYRAHCREDTSPCADHCRQHALSDMKCKNLQKLCDHEHRVTCDSCEALKTTLLSVLTKIQSPELEFYSEEQQKDLLYDARQARGMVLEWKAHILRAENQDTAKKEVLKSLPPDAVFILMDWAMKFTQIKYREKQCEWYGKRGMSWHVSCVVSNSTTTNDLHIASYVHLLDNCTQDWYAVGAILIHLLNTLKETQPHITKAYLRSDGAGCYHNNYLIAALNDLGKHTGITVLRYDFSEPQFGKDICDRIISPLKGTIRRYCIEGHDIMSSSDMHEALKARPVKGTTAAVCELQDDVPQEMNVNRIKNFSAFHNFSYDKTGLSISKAYGIGSGKVVTWSELNVQNQSIPTLSVLDDHRFFKMEPRLMKVSQEMPPSNTDSKNEEILLECKEPSCSLTFTSLDELKDHMNFGQHSTTTVKNQESLYDKLRREWVSKFSTLSDKNEETQAFKETPVSNESSLEAAGWALQKPRISSKFSDNVKSYLTAKFDAGITGRKADPAQVSQDMRKARKDDGSRKFTREEWLTKVQIKSFFSRLSAARRKQQAVQDDDIDDDDLVEEEQEFEEEKIRDEMTRDVLSQLGVEHAITYDGYDICDCVKSKTLSRFNCKILKSMCEYFELPFKSRDNKAVLLGKIIDMVKDCSCST